MSTGNLWGVDAATAEAYDNAYWPAQPNAVQALKGVSFAPDPSTGQRPSVTLGQQLLAQGYQIDIPIMVWGNDPYLEMLQRKADGFDWVAAAGQTPGGGTGQTPPGAITVTLTPLPPFNPPPPPTPTPTVSPIGPDLGTMINGKEAFSCAATDLNPIGFTFSDATGTYVKTALGNELMDPQRRVCVWLKQ